MLIVHAPEGSRMLAFAQQVISWGKPVMCLEGEENAALIRLGVKPVYPNQLPVVEANVTGV